MDDFNEFDIDQILSEFMASSEQYAEPVKERTEIREEPENAVEFSEVTEETNPPEEPDKEEPLPEETLEEETDLPEVEPLSPEEIHEEELPETMPEAGNLQEAEEPSLPEEVPENMTEESAEENPPAEPETEDDGEDSAPVRKIKKEKKPRMIKERKPAKPVNRKLLAVGLAFASVLALLIAGALFAGGKIQNGEKNLPNLKVGGINVGGMTGAETLDALRAQGWTARESAPLQVITIGDVSVDIDTVQSGVIISTENAVRAAHDYGREKGKLNSLLSYVRCMLGSVDLNEELRSESRDYIESRIAECKEKLDAYMGEEEYRIDLENEQLVMRKGWGQLQLDDEALYAAIVSAIGTGEQEIRFTDLKSELAMPDFETIRVALEKEPVNASYTDDGKFNVIDEVVGCKLDVAQAESLWRQGAPGEDIKVPLFVTWPEVTGQELRDRLFHDLLGAMSTRYTNSVENRCSNVRLCASKFNDYILYPGEIFAYNKIVGARTEEAGFLPAPAYVGLEGSETVKDEIGGGACQVSSTLYSATLFAFLETVERTCHIYPVNYMQIGLDATVTIPDGGQEMDFKFRNNKNYPIKIVTYTNESEEEKKLTIEIWGTLEEDDYMPVEFDARWYWEQDYDRFVDPSQEGRPGYTIKLTHDTYSSADEIGPTVMTQTRRQVIDSEGNMIENEITNMVNPNTGYPTMDTYHEHH